MHPFPTMFEPVRLGPKTSRNRLMRLATTSNLGDDGLVGPRSVAFYRRVAHGGVGVLVTESLRIHPSTRGNAGQITVFKPDVIPGLEKLAAAVHEEGALLIGQLNHGGRQHHGNLVPTMWAPSAIACPHSGGVPHEMSLEEIEEMIEHFVTSARHCAEAGLDGVEIHGAQGHLIQEFLSPFSNQRQDRYGGSWENRTRFAKEIIGRTREAIGPEFIVGYRMGVEEFNADGISIEDSERLAKELAGEGKVDYLSLSQGNFDKIETHLPDRHYPHGVFLELHARIKAVAGSVPVIASTRIQTPEEAEAVLAAGQADMIGMCRAFVVDPDWPAKAAAGLSDTIRRCIACNECWATIITGRPIRCVQNAETGRELELGELTKAPQTLSVMVVGAGPAGMEAARVAALRGHNVSLVEREASLGGKLVDASQVEHHTEIRNVVDYLEGEIQRLGVRVATETEVSLADVVERHPDRVVIATGSAPASPRIQTDGSVPVVTGAAPAELAAEAWGRVVIVDEDGYYWAAQAAEALAGRCDLTIVTRFFEAFRELPVISRIATLENLDRHGVRLECNTELGRIENGSVVLKHYYSGRETEISDVNALVYVGVQEARDDLYRKLQREDIQVTLIGDAFAPRRIVDAIREGYEAGRAL